MCAYHHTAPARGWRGVAPPRRLDRSAKVRLSEVILTAAAGAVLLGRYLDVEITLVHRGRMVMRGPRCARVLHHAPSAPDGGAHDRAGARMCAGRPPGGAGRRPDGAGREPPPRSG